MVYNVFVYWFRLQFGNTLICFFTPFYPQMFLLCVAIFPAYKVVK